MDLNIKQHADAVVQAIESTILFKKAADLLKQFEDSHPEIAAFFGAHGAAHEAADDIIAKASDALPEIKAAATSEVAIIKADAVEAKTEVGNAITGLAGQATADVAEALDKADTKLGEVIADVAPGAALTNTATAAVDLGSAFTSDVIPGSLAATEETKTDTAAPAA